MSLRHDISPRYFSFDGAQNDELARLAESTQQQLSQIPLVSYRWVRNVLAGATGEPLASVLWGPTTEPLVTTDALARPPDVASLARCVLLSSPDSPVDISPGLNFRYQASPDGRNQVILLQPAGLTTGELYDLVVMFVAGVGG